MKAFVIILIALLSFNVLQGQSWQKHKFEDLGMIAYFPDKPDRTKQQVNTALGELDMHIIMYAPTSGDDNLVYSIIRTDYPEAVFENADDEHNKKMLDGAVQGAVSNAKGKLLFDNTVKFNGYPGRKVKVEIESGFMYLNCILMGNAMFIWQLICEKGKDGNQSIDRFLDSFEIIKVKGQD